MKVFHLNHSDIRGGAARAAYRIHQALRMAGIDSSMMVNVAASGDWTIHGPQSKFEKLSVIFRPVAGSLAKRLLLTDNPVIHSPAILPSIWPNFLNNSVADVLHLHWVGNEMLSIADIGRLNKPVIWTLHDMWAFCGAEHYTEDFRWQEGYHHDNRPANESGFDVNRWTWRRKKRHWRTQMHLVAPSQWMANCVRQSALLRDWPVTVIPNPINTDRWYPIDREQARALLGLPQNVPILLFGAMGVEQDPRKGFHLLHEALSCLHSQKRELQLVVFGQLSPKHPPELGFPTHYMGHLHDDLSLQTLYSAANILIIPSLQDNLPNTGVEAHACGTPVVAFNTGGLPDIIDHQRTGYLAKPFDTRDLVEGIKWVLDNEEKIGIRIKARQKAVKQFANQVVTDGYSRVFNQAISINNRPQRGRY